MNYIALYSGDLSLDNMVIMKASIMLYSIIFALIVKSAFPDASGLDVPYVSPITSFTHHL